MKYVLLRDATLDWTATCWTYPNCNTLHCTELQYAAVQRASICCTGLNCNMLHCTELQYATLDWTATCYTGLNWNTLHWTELHYTTLAWTAILLTSFKYIALTDLLDLEELSHVPVRSKASSGVYGKMLYGSRSKQYQFHSLLRRAAGANNMWHRIMSSSELLGSLMSVWGN